jgi:hypothetical protein
MKKRRETRSDNFTPEDRKRKLNFKKKKQRQDEEYFNPKRLSKHKIKDFKDFEEDDIDR